MWKGKLLVVTFQGGELVCLVDFGNTLVDETFLWRDTDAFPDWTRQWSEVMNDYATSWDTGKLGTEDVLNEMARRLGCSYGLVRANFDTLCSDVTVHPAVIAALRARRLRQCRQAIVTVNPDCFGWLVELCGLADLFDLVVTSSEIGTTDKAEICSVACDRLGVAVARTVLIDNLPQHVEAWMTRGGSGYLYSNDDQFAQDIAGRRIPGFDPTDLLG